MHLRVVECGYQIVTATPEHIKALSGNLRADDAAEAQAMGWTGEEAVAASYRTAIFSKALIVKGEVAAAWGMWGTPLGRVGHPWLATAPVAECVKRAFLRVGRAEVASMLAMCPELVGIVDGRYLRAIRLLRVLGFTVSAPFPYGPENVPFCEYRLRRAA